MNNIDTAERLLRRIETLEEGRVPRAAECLARRRVVLSQAIEALTSNEEAERDGNHSYVSDVRSATEAVAAAEVELRQARAELAEKQEELRSLQADVDGDHGLVAIEIASVVNLTVTVYLDGYEHEYEVRPTPRRRPWSRIACDIADRIARAGGLPGSDRGLSDCRIRVSAELRGGDDEVDITKQILTDGWRHWLRVDRELGASASCSNGFRSTPERDARLRADDELSECALPDEEFLHRKLDAALAVEDAAMLARIEMIGAAVETADTPSETRAPAETQAGLDRALDRLDRHHGAAVAAARASRDAAEVAETSALAAFLAAQEARRTAQAELDEVLAVGELFEGSAADEGVIEPEGGGWLRAPDSPDADEPEVFLLDVPGTERPVPPETEDDRHWLRFAA